ncbi:MAG: SUMF1/EgtB/PvdO family nonheme iron enzyme, partial [Acidobacteria bacterium]|nr:SUMF1/EgtB/PvdO family nonheme iron enzyme [Acidobacteriota bacterium]
AGEAVLAGFDHARIADLEMDQIAAFLDKWSAALYGDNPGKKEEFGGGLMRAVRARPDLRKVARNPVMLTALAVVQWNEKRLPEQRADLYESVLTWLARARADRPGRLKPEQCLERLRQLALAMQDHPEGRQVQVPRRWAADALVPPFPDVQEAEVFLRQEEEDSGIIVGRGDEERFWHLSFQEYLAAREIGGLGDSQIRGRVIDSGRLYQPEWREVMLLLAGVLQKQGRAKVDSLFGAVLDEVGATLPERAKCAGLAGAMLRDLAPAGYGLKDPRYTAILEAVMGIFDAKRSEKIDIRVRIEAAEALGQAGDPRLDQENWVPIPGGVFWMGAQKKKPSARNYDKEAFPDEVPVRKVTLDDYRIGRYPVTVHEYAKFVDDGGYFNDRWWRAGGFGKFEEPEAWVVQLEHPNRPVTRVGWYEAAAYCAWAKGRLPTEAEWERAARGPGGTKYPWGDEEIDVSRANYSYSRIEHPTPVGLYPKGRSPEGVDDLIGNVVEWCADWFGPYPAGDARNPLGPDKGTRKVVRGASFYDGARILRAASRIRFVPDYRFVNSGFRCVRESLDS